MFSHDRNLLKNILADVCPQLAPGITTIILIFFFKIKNNNCNKIMTEEEIEEIEAPYADEVVALVNNGNSANRIDLVFMVLIIFIPIFSFLFI